MRELARASVREYGCAVSDSANLPLGFVLDGKWRLDAVLGVGGMGSVYAAEHVRNGSRVAVKVLHADVARDGASRDRFRLEGYAANRVDHPGVVRVLDDGTTGDGLPYLVMERLHGMSLEAVSEQTGGTMPLEDVLRYGCAALEIVGAAHAKGIVHRDLKPENLFVCKDGAVKVLDFGIASVKEVVSQTRLTTTGVPMGTPAYMPAEQALARWTEVDARSDVWSLGASFFSLLTGQIVHIGTTVPELIVAVSTTDARPVRSLVPHVPPAIGAVIDRALRRQRSERFADATEMLTALRAAMNGQAPIDQFVDAGTNPDVLQSVAGRSAHKLQNPALRGTGSPVSTDPSRRAKRGSKRSPWPLIVTLTGVALVGSALGVVASKRFSAPQQGTALTGDTSSPTLADSAPDSAPAAEASTAPETVVTPVDTGNSINSAAPFASSVSSNEPTAKPAAKPSAVPKPQVNQPTSKPVATTEPARTAAPCVFDKFTRTCK